MLQVPKAVPLRDGEVKSVQAGRMDMEKREHEKTVLYNDNKIYIYISISICIYVMKVTRFLFVPHMPGAMENLPKHGGFNATFICKWRIFQHAMFDYQGAHPCSCGLLSRNST